MNCSTLRERAIGSSPSTSQVSLLHTYSVAYCHTTELNTTTTELLRVLLAASRNALLLPMGTATPTLGTLESGAARAHPCGRPIARMVSGAQLQRLVVVSGTGVFSRKPCIRRMRVPVVVCRTWRANASRRQLHFGQLLVGTVVPRSWAPPDTETIVEA